MKRALTIVLALGLSGAVFADDAEKKPAPETTTTADSPMVAAAKRANRKGKKAENVITNETLNKSGAGAHVTTTAKQRPLTVPKEPPHPTPEMLAVQAREAEKRRVAAEAAKEQKAAEAKERAVAAAAAAAEEGLYDADELEPAEPAKPPQR